MLWGGLFLALGPLRTPGDGDLYWQRWLGELLLQTHRLPASLGPETFTAAGSPWVPQEWLFSLAVALAREHHVFMLLSVLVSALPLAILFSIYQRSRNDGTEPAATGIALLFCGVAFLESFGARAQVLGWAALAAFMLFIERRDRWYYAAFPTAIIWANLHASVAIAPAIVAARILATLVAGGVRAIRASRDVAMLPAVLLALFCTPFGWRLPALTLALATSPIRHYIAEWLPPSPGDLSFVLGALPLAIAVLAGGRSTLTQRMLQSFPAALLFASMLFASRNIALFAIVVTPLAARGLQTRFPSTARLGARVAEMEPVALPAIGLAMLLSVLALMRIQLHSPSPLPSAAIASLGSDGRDHRIFCEDFTWCSMALAYPSLRVFIDGRCDGYPLPVWRQYVETVQVRKSWSEPLQRYGVDFVVAKRGSLLALAMEKAHWARAYHDQTFVLLRRE